MDNAVVFAAAGTDGGISIVVMVVVMVLLLLLSYLGCRFFYTQDSPMITCDYFRHIS